MNLPAAMKFDPLHTDEPLAAEAGPHAVPPAPAGEAQALDEPAAAPVPLVGSFDGYEGLTAVGWARDEANGDTPLVVDVFADQRWVASGVADLFRGDLRQAGIGSGRYGFRVALPFDLCDGDAHEITVRAGANAVELRPGVRDFRQQSTLTARVEGLDGAFVVGWVKDMAQPEATFGVELHVDGRLVETGRAAQPCPEGFRFAMRLPRDLLDGRPHTLSVCVSEPFHVVGECAAVTPAILTPDDSLQRYAGAQLNAALLTGAAARYEGLRRQLLALTDTADAADAPPAAEQLARLRQVAQAHELVVRGFGETEHSAKTRMPLVFAPVAAPLVSLVIPVHNKFAVTYHCLASLLLAHNRASFEVIVVDDGSSDDTLTLPAVVKGVTLVRHDVSQGFVRSCNAGGRAARGRYIVMLNNDTEATPGWIDELLHVFDHFDNVGMAGSKLLYPDGKLQEAGGIVWGSGDPWNYGRNGNARDPRYNYTRQVDYISGACIMLPKELWDTLGGFDEHFAPAYFEDTDLAFRVRDKGLKTVYAPFSQVVHFEGLSSGTSVASGTKRYQEINRPKFRARWSRAYRGNGTVGQDVELNKDRNVNLRVLVIDLATPQPDRDAGSYAAIQEMRLLQSLGAKLTFIPDNLAYLGQYTDALQRMGVECVYAPYVLSVHELLEQRGSEFDLVYVTRYSVAERHTEAIRRLAPRAKLVFNNADLHFLRELRAAIAFKSKEVMDRAVKTREAELAAMRAVDLVLSYNEVEHAVIMSHNLDSTRVARCPWVVEIPPQVPPFEARRDIAFLGGFAHHPNVEAVEFFVREVMPQLRERLPGVALRIYGSNMPERLLKLVAKDVIAEGWVADVATVYNHCRVFIAPLLTGAGIKGKVIGALAYGVPSVLSPLAAEGTGIRDGLEALVAETPAQWVDAIARLHEDPAAWQAQHRAARAFAEREYGFARGQKLMQAALAAVDIFASPDAACLMHD